MTRRNESPRLRALARLHGIQTSYGDVRKQRVEASEETLRALLSALGVPTNNASQCEDSWREGIASVAARRIDDVVVAWEGLLTSIDIHASSYGDDALPELHVVLEDGAIVGVCLDRSRMETLRRTGPVPTTSLRLHLQPPLVLPAGYHHLVCTTGGRQTSSLLLASPKRCYCGDEEDGREWGLFAPLYALRGEPDRGAGSYSELESLARYTAHMGGGLVGTLPLLPCYYDAGDPSPYLPVTRLLWSEFYIDAGRIPFLDDPSGVLSSAETIRRVGRPLAVSRIPQVDYGAVERARRTALREVYGHLDSSTPLQAEVQQFLALHPRISDYAAFRATEDSLRTSWRRWPAQARDGALSPDLYAGGERGFREFEQWLAHRQMSELLNNAEAQDVGLYLDLPVGVHPDGYDTWRFRESFVSGAATGAPPDIVFTAGQRWGSPPIHPTAIRRQHYDYARQYLAHHMRAARMLRIDHVMGLHRIFCIPEGAEPSSGAYLRYRPEEWYAILSLESHRHRTVLIGEDLGLVPSEVHRSMSRHGLNRMFVLYYEMDGIAAGARPSVPHDCLAGLNTHDMPTFSAMWQGLDIRQQQRVGILNPADAPDVRRRRRRALKSLLDLLRSVCPTITAADGLDIVLRCTLGWLGASRARYVVVNVEDLWHETEQQNIPGVGDAYPSWRQRAARTMNELWHSADAAAALSLLRDAMRRGRPEKGAEQSCRTR